MKTHVLVGLLAVIPFARSQGAEKVVTPAIDSVAMFKNGLTVVHSSFEAPGAGDYVWVDPPGAVHGAFFVESEPGLVIRSTTRMMKAEGPSLPSGNLQRDLAGATVSVTMVDGDGVAGEVRGTVWSVPAGERAEWDRRYVTTDGNASPWASYSPLHRSRRPPGSEGAVSGNWLVIEADGGRRYLPTGRIGEVRVEREVDGPAETLRPVMVFSVENAGEVKLSYLTKGMAWAPAYQIDLLAGDRLLLRQTAVVRNELMELAGARLDLISGYPNIKFGHVSSPLNAGATLAGFFQQISQQGGGGRGAATQQVAYNALSNFSAPSPAAAPPEPAAPAEDLHYEGIGVHHLREGDSLSLEVASAEASCERIVEWKVPDYRDDQGRMRRGSQRSEEEEPWDAVQFANPLSFPMTTAAASVLEGGGPRGQSMATWTAPGQVVCVRINKALTVRGEHSEIEEEGEREIVWVAGNDYQRTVVKGTLKVSSARSEAVTMAIRADFSGELLAADGDPAKTLRADGARSVNPHRQLEWKIELGGGEERTLEYRYSLLVDR